MLRESITNDWFTIALLIGLTAVVISKFLYVHRFSDFVSVLGNSKYLKIYARNQKFIDGFDSLFFLNFIISISTFIYIGLASFGQIERFDLNFFVKILFGVGVLTLSKILIERLIGSLFDIDTIIDQYLFQKTTYKNFSGLILLPLNCILIYTLEPSKAVIYSIISLILLINLVGFIISFKNHQKTLLANFFYFILYLCALEIGPYLILTKLIIDFNA
ncbi:MAG: DUF4271 domain-containing protein [Bacteroidota bacterium]